MKWFKYKMILRNALNSYANNNSKSVKINEQSYQHHWYCFYDWVTQSHLHCIYYWCSVKTSNNISHTTYLILEEIMHKDVKITGKNGFVLLDIC